jgi:hypothetical protein
MSSCGQEIVAWIDFRIEGERSEVDNKKEDDPDPQEDVPLGDRCGSLTGGGSDTCGAEEDSCCGCPALRTLTTV